MTMPPVIAVARVELWALLVGMGGRSRTRRRWSIGALVGLVGLGTLALSWLYSYGLATLLAPAGAVDLVLVLIPLFTVMMTVAATTFGAGGSALLGRDDVLLLSQPVSRRTVVAARTAAVSVQSILLTLLAVLPSGVAYAMHAPIRWWYWPALVLGSVALALAATAVSIALAWVMSLVIPSAGRGRVVANVTALVALVSLVMASVPAAQRLEEVLLSDPQAFVATVEHWTWGARALRDLAVDGSWTAGLLLLALAVATLAAVSTLIGATYGRNVGLGTRTRRGVQPGRHRRWRTRSPFVALLRHESQRFTASTVYLVNTSFGVVVLLVGAGWLLAGGGLPEAVPALATATGIPLAVMAAIAVTGPVALTCTTAPSISLEGGRLWILRSAPVDPLVVLGAKVALNLLLVVPVLVPVSVALTVAIDGSVVEGLAILAIGSLTSLVVAQAGLLANLAWPVLDAVSDVVVVKQSISVLVALVAGLAVSAALTTIGVLAGQAGGTTAGLAGMVLVAALLAVALFGALRTWGVGTFSRLD